MADRVVCGSQVNRTMGRVTAVVSCFFSLRGVYAIPRAYARRERIVARRALLGFSRVIAIPVTREIKVPVVKGPFDPAHAKQRLRFCFH